MGLAERYYSIIKYKYKHYTTYSIPKKSGGIRKIIAPSEELKDVQRQILQWLYWIKVHPAAHGFVEGKSIYTNAARHTNSVCVVNLDLKDFFPSITKKRVIEELTKYVTTPNAIGELITYEDALPQGTPTSPYMSNIVCMELDTKLTNLAQKHKARYTRYADDITFSSKTNKDLHKIIAKAHSFIKKQGFTLNYNKIHVMRRGGRQMVTGLTVNDRVNVPRPRVKNFRAEVHKADFDGGSDDFREFARLMGFSSFIFGANKKKGVKFFKKIRGMKDGSS